MAGVCAHTRAREGGGELARGVRETRRESGCGSVGSLGKSIYVVAVLWWSRCVTKGCSLLEIAEGVLTARDCCRGGSVKGCYLCSLLEIVDEPRSNVFLCSLCLYGPVCVHSGPLVYELGQ